MTIITAKKLFISERFDMKNIMIFARDKKSGEEMQFTLNDLYGYEGEVCGVLIGDLGIPLNYNSGYGFEGMNPDIEILDAKIVEEREN